MFIVVTDTASRVHSTIETALDEDDVADLAASVERLRRTERLGDVWKDITTRCLVVAS